MDNKLTKEQLEEFSISISKFGTEYDFIDFCKLLGLDADLNDNSLSMAKWTHLHSLVVGMRGLGMDTLWQLVLVSTFLTK